MYFSPHSALLTLLIPIHCFAKWFFCINPDIKTQLSLLFFMKYLFDIMQKQNFSLILTSKIKQNFYYCFYYYFALLGFELRASCLLGRPCSTWATSPAHRQDFWISKKCALKYFQSWGKLFIGIFCQRALSFCNLQDINTSWIREDSLLQLHGSSDL